MLVCCSAQSQGCKEGLCSVLCLCSAQGRMNGWAAPSQEPQEQSRCDNPIELQIHSLVVNSATVCQVAKTAACKDLHLV